MKTKVSSESSVSLPRPFYDDWPRSTRAEAQALWDWHTHLARSAPAVDDNRSVDDFFDEEQERVKEGQSVRLVPDRVWQSAYRACETHDLPRRLLAVQVGAARRLHGSLRFADSSALNAFSRQWAAAHGRLLAGIVGLDGSVQLQYVDEVARGFFFVGRLVTLPEDLQERDHLFIPNADLEQSGVTAQDLRRGEPDERLRRLLWKQTIRARDALGQGQPLSHELPWYRRPLFKRWWYGALEVVGEIERRDYDLWSKPITLSTFRRVQIYLQGLLGRAASR